MMRELAATPALRELLGAESARAGRASTPERSPATSTPTSTAIGTRRTAKMGPDSTPPRSLYHRGAVRGIEGCLVPTRADAMDPAGDHRDAGLG